MNQAMQYIKKIQNNNALTILFNTIRFAVFLGIVIVIFGWARTNVPFISKYEIFVVQTDSMVPVINIDDAVVVDTSADPNVLQQGDIISFYVDLDRNGTDEVIVHYFDSYVFEDGETLIRTRPASNPDLDPWRLHPDDVIGKYSFGLRYLGKLVGFASSQLGRIVIIVDVILISVLLDLLGNPNKNKKKEK
jgi:signal peptidase I